MTVRPDPGHRDRVEAVFEEALELSGEARDAYVQAACGEDVALERDVRALLAAHDRSGILEVASRHLAELADDGSGPREERIGPYQVLRRLGRGGMGAVYLAERDDGQFRRRVAVKVLRSGADDLPIYRRFLAERQILASLDHPNIARLYDGGVTDAGRPWLAMEYVEGLPITEYCDRHRLGIDERVRLFQAVCAAVHYAHQNLVLHRDIKPSNILVGSDGQAKLLDFGIAKLLNPGLGHASAPVTRTEYRALTPEYASPEQVRGDPLTTASDVYALGVVLYELLAGHRPYRLTRRSPDEVMRAVVERDPERPSTRVTRVETVQTADGPATAITPASIGAARGLTPERLQRRLRGDLDVIVMMALRKEPNRRYASAQMLSDDIGRYLDGEAVVAQRGSRTYRLWRRVQRHRLEAAATVLVVLALLVGSAVALWQASVAQRERDRAESALAQAETSLSESRAVTDFLVQLFEASSPEDTGGDTIRARELLRRGEARAELLAGSPAVQARMLDVVGRVHQSLGRYAEAVALLDRALAIRRRVFGDRHPETAETLAHLGAVLRFTADYTRSIACWREALSIRRAALGDADPLVHETMVALGGMLIYRGRLDEAERIYLEALQLQTDALGDEHADVANTLVPLASLLRVLNRGDESEAMFRRALDLRRRALGPRDPQVGATMFHVADMTWNNRRDTAEALRLYREGVAILRESLGERHPVYAANVGRMAGAMHDYGMLADAEAAYRQALDLNTRSLGPDHPSVAMVRSSLAAVIGQRGRFDEAERLFADAIAAARSQLGSDNAIVAGMLINVARLRMQRADPAGAEPAILEALRIRRAASGPEVPLVGITLSELARTRGARGDHAAADSLFEESLRILRINYPDDHDDIRRVHSLATDYYESIGDSARAARHRAGIGSTPRSGSD